jgi:hypothetical protein
MQVSRIRTTPFRRKELKQRIALRKALYESMEGFSLPTRKIDVTSDQIHKLVQRIRSL